VSNLSISNSITFKDDTFNSLVFILVTVLARQVGVQPPLPPGSGAAGRSPAA